MLDHKKLLINFCYFMTAIVIVASIFRFLQSQDFALSYGLLFVIFPVACVYLLRTIQEYKVLGYMLFGSIYALMNFSLLVGGGSESSSVLIFPLWFAFLWIFWDYRLIALFAFLQAGFLSILHLKLITTDLGLDQFEDAYPFLYTQSIFGFILNGLIFIALRDVSLSYIKAIRVYLFPLAIVYFLGLLTLDYLTDHQSFIANHYWILAPVWALVQSAWLSYAGFLAALVFTLLYQHSYQGLLPNEWYAITHITLYVLLGVMTLLFAPIIMRKIKAQTLALKS